MTTIIIDRERFRGIIHPHTVTPTLVLVPQGPGLDVFPGHEPVVVPEDGRTEVPSTARTGGTVWYQLQALWEHRGYWPHDLHIPESGEHEVCELVELQEWEQAQLDDAAEGVWTLDEDGCPGAPAPDPLAAQMAAVGASGTGSTDG